VIDEKEKEMAENGSDSSETPEVEAPTVDNEEPKEPEEDKKDDTETQDAQASDGEVSEDQEVPDPLDQVAELEKKQKETMDRLLRTAAELDNVRKRARRDVADAAVRGQVEVLRDILPVMDSIDLALKSTDSDSSSAGIVQGVQMIQKQFLNCMDKFGLKAIPTSNCGFDPNFHEAVAQIPSDQVDAGQIIDEMRKGFLLGERLLRASMVVVSKGPQEKPPSEEPATTKTDVEQSDTENETIDETVDETVDENADEPVNKTDDVAKTDTEAETENKAETKNKVDLETMADEKQTDSEDTPETSEDVNE
jgi:molecular chaperone GrpE